MGSNVPNVSLVDVAVGKTRCAWKICSVYEETDAGGHQEDTDRHQVGFLSWCCMKTTVVNIKHLRGDCTDVVMCDRGTIWGNPYNIRDDTDAERDRVCGLYKARFEQKMLSDVGFFRATMALKGRRLGCHCVPKRCHVQIIVDFLEE